MQKLLAAQFTEASSVSAVMRLEHLAGLCVVGLNPHGVSGSAARIT